MEPSFVWNPFAYRSEALIFVFDSEYFNSVIIGFDMGRPYTSSCHLLRIGRFLRGCEDWDHLLL